MTNVAAVTTSVTDDVVLEVINTLSMCLIVRLAVSACVSDERSSTTRV
jgi:hypothetical protein